MLIDLHVHSNLASRSTLEPGEIIIRARQAGLDAVCFTEDTPFADWKALKDAGDEMEFSVFVGLDLQTEHGRLLAYLPDPELVEPDRLLPKPRDGARYRSDKVVEAVLNAGGVVAAAAPYHRDEKPSYGDRIFRMEGITAVETKNARCPLVVNDFALEAAENLRLPGLGGSDVRDSLQHIGRSASLIGSSAADEAELVQALSSGDVWAVEIADPSALPSRPKPPPPRQYGDRDRRGGRDRYRSGGRGRGGPRDSRSRRGPRGR